MGIMPKGTTNGVSIDVSRVEFHKGVLRLERTRGLAFLYNEAVSTMVD
jgi:hypothetical protein